MRPPGQRPQGILGQADRRTQTTVVHPGVADDVHTLYIYASLERWRTGFDGENNDYLLDATHERVYLGANGERLAQLRPDEAGLPAYTGEARVFFEFADHLGSANTVVDKRTGELVEKRTYTAYGSIESDHRQDRWGQFREDYGFTTKEEDVEVGLTYFGKRFYNPRLGRWLNADPLAVHSPGEADLNLYAYVSGRVFSSVDPLGLCGRNSNCEEKKDSLVSLTEADWEDSRSRLEERARQENAVDPDIQAWNESGGGISVPAVDKVIKEARQIKEVLTSKVVTAGGSYGSERQLAGPLGAGFSVSGGVVIDLNKPLLQMPTLYVGGGLSPVVLGKSEGGSFQLGLARSVDDFEGSGTEAQVSVGRNSVAVTKNDSGETTSIVFGRAVTATAGAGAHVGRTYTLYFHPIDALVRGYDTVNETFKGRDDGADPYDGGQSSRAGEASMAPPEADDKLVCASGANCSK